MPQPRPLPAYTTPLGRAYHADASDILGQLPADSVALVFTSPPFALRRKKAKRILACATHGVLSGPALQRLANTPLDVILLTNTIPLDGARKLPNMTVLSVAGLLAKAIRSIHCETSVSNLFV